MPARSTSESCARAGLPVWRSGQIPSRQSPRDLDEAMPHRGRMLHRRLPALGHRQQGEVLATGLDVGKQGLGNLSGLAGDAQVAEVLVGTRVEALEAGS